MNIIYFGNPDNLAKKVMERFAKEEDKVFLLSEKNFSSRNKITANVTFFKWSANYTLNSEVIAGIKPDYIIFAGQGFFNQTYYRESKREEYLGCLSFFLSESKNQQVKKIIYLSSTEIYQPGLTSIDENSPINPESEKGMISLEAETLIRLYTEKKNLNAAILRCADIYERELGENRQVFPGNLLEYLEKEELLKGENTLYYPVSVDDLSEAIIRVRHGGGSSCFNVVASVSIDKSSILNFFIQKSQCGKVQCLTDTTPYTISNEALKKETEWVDFYSLEKELKTDKITFSMQTVKEKGIKSKFPQRIRKLIENVVIFIMFAAICIYTQNNAVFSEVDWMPIYLVISGIYFGSTQSVVSVLLASVFYFWHNDVSIMEMTNFYSYVSCVLKLAEYIFLSSITSYSISMMKEVVRGLKQDKILLETELEEIKQINKENVRIKQEYEKRILNTKESLPMLYKVISKINVLEADKILTEILKVIVDFVETDTVAVYQLKENTSFARLVVAQNDESIYQGKSWDLNQTPDIREALQNQELYVGEYWNEMPAFVIPITNNKRSVAAIVIKNIKFENNSLYQINLLRTLSILISETIAKALEYENVTKQERYLENTEILNEEYFEKELSVQKEKKEQGVSEFSLIHILSKESLGSVYPKAKACSRDTDKIGMRRDKEIYILLSNSSVKESEIVVKRLEERGLSSKLERI